jgi:hypothetical protein
LRFLNGGLRFYFSDLGSSYRAICERGLTLINFPCKLAAISQAEIIENPGLPAIICHLRMPVVK